MLGRWNGDGSGDGGGETAVRSYVRRDLRREETRREATRQDARRSSPAGDAISAAPRRSALFSVGRSGVRWRAGPVLIVSSRTCGHPPQRGRGVRCMGHQVASCLGHLDTAADRYALEMPHYPATGLTASALSLRATAAESDRYASEMPHYPATATGLTRRCTEVSPDVLLPLTSAGSSEAPTDRNRHIPPLSQRRLSATEAAPA